MIVGGESGPGAHPMQRAWAELLRAQCAQVGIPFFFKQVGANRGPEWPGITGRKGDDPGQWPPDLRLQQFPA